MDNELENSFNKLLNELINKTCWSVIAGKGTWPDIHLDIGDKIPLIKPIGNEYLSEEQRNYEGEYAIYIECVWRIDSETEVICGAIDSIDNNEDSLIKLESLTGLKVKSIVLSKPAFDLDIVFDNNLALKIFCHSTDIDEGYGNWTLFDNKHSRVFIIKTKSVLVEETYDSTGKYRTDAGIEP